MKKNLKIKTNELLDLIIERRSCRQWLDRKIAKKDIDLICEAGRYAPSSCNRQNVKFLILDNKKDIAFLAGSLGGALGYGSFAPILIAIFVDMRSYVLPVERNISWLDGAAAIENMLLMAHAFGFGAVWLSWVIKAERENEILKRFNIDTYYRPISCIALGYPKVFAPMPPRKNLSKFLIKY